MMLGSVQELKCNDDAIVEFLPGVMGAAEKNTERTSFVKEKEIAVEVCEEISKNTEYTSLVQEETIVVEVREEISMKEKDTSLLPFDKIFPEEFQNQCKANSVSTSMSSSISAVENNIRKNAKEEVSNNNSSCFSPRKSRSMDMVSSTIKMRGERMGERGCGHLLLLTEGKEKKIFSSNFARDTGKEKFVESLRKSLLGEHQRSSQRSIHSDIECPKQPKQDQEMKMNIVFENVEECKEKKMVTTRCFKKIVRRARSMDMVCSNVTGHIVNSLSPSSVFAAKPRRERIRRLSGEKGFKSLSLLTEGKEKKVFSPIFAQDIGDRKFIESLRESLQGE